VRFLVDGPNTQVSFNWTSRQSPTAADKLTEDESGICVPYLVEICSTDWGWWRTVTMVAARSSDRAAQILIDQTERETVQTRLTQILSALESSKKSRKWQMRARIGDRVAWHEDPEEVEHR